MRFKETVWMSGSLGVNCLHKPAFCKFCYLFNINNRVLHFYNLNLQN